jgi:hypothetical protein
MNPSGITKVFTIFIVIRLTSPMNNGDGAVLPHNEFQTGDVDKPNKISTFFFEITNIGQ